MSAGAVESAGDGPDVAKAIRVGIVGPVDLGAPELLIVLLVVLVLFGGAKLPQLARSLGQAKNEFEKSVRGEPEPQSAPTPVALPASETVTLSRQELDRLVDERVDERTKAAEKTDAGEGSVH